MAAAEENLQASTPKEVAAAFVQKYYDSLCHSSEELLKFYRDSIVVSWLGRDGNMKQWTKAKDITNHALPSLDCEECVIFSIDTQFSIENALIILVTGCMITKNDTMTKFTQSFILAPMEKADEFSVLNDVLRFLGEEETDFVPEKASKEVENDVTIAPKKSFLSVLNENTASFKPQPMSKPVSTAPKKNNNGSIDSIGNPIKGKSIFVGNLDPNVEIEEVYEAFKSFGGIKPNGVRIRTDQHNRSFGFIEFESATSAQNAIQASFTRIRGRKVHIEERKSNGGVAGRGKFPPCSDGSNSSSNGYQHDNVGLNHRHNGKNN